MNENSADQNEKATVTCCGEALDSETVGKCPMAAMCQGMLSNTRIGLVFLLPGLVFVLAGILILLEPRVLIWLIGGTLILLGVVMLVMTMFLRRLGAGLRQA